MQHRRILPYILPCKNQIQMITQISFAVKLGEGDCDGPGDGGQHDEHRGCLPGQSCNEDLRRFLRSALIYYWSGTCINRPLQ